MRLLVALVVCVSAWTRSGAAAQPDPGADIDRLLAECATLTAQGHYRDVSDRAQQAVALSRRLGDRERLFKSLNQLGASYFYQSRPADALTVHTEVLALAGELGRPELQAVAANNIGLEYRELHDLDRALPFLERARSLEHDLGRTDREANALRNIAALYFSMGAYDTARGYAAAAVRLAREHHHELYEAMALEMLALTETHGRQYVRALAHYRAALALDDRLKVPALRPELLTDLAVLYYETKRYAKTIATVEPILSATHESGYRELEAIGFELIGGSYLARGDLARAADALTRARAIYARLDDPAQRSWQLDVLFARLEKARNRPEAARDSYGAALAAIERVRAGAVGTEVDRSTVIATRRDAFVEAADLLVSMNRPSEALAIAERYRARVFLDLLAGSRADRPSPLRDSTLDAAGVRERVRPCSALIEYLLGQPRSLAWVVTSHAIHVVSLAGRDAIDSQVARYRQTVVGPVSSLTAAAAARECREQSRRLARLVLDPLEPALARIDRLVIVADGTLSYVPFEALATRGRPAFLLERAAVSYAPSASALAALVDDARGPSRAPHSLLAFGDPTYPAQSGFSPLPESGAEVDAIARLFPPDDRRVYGGREATAAALGREALDRYRYIHFAAHAVIDEHRPSRSGIVLSYDEESRGGLLRVDEIAALHLDADLVTLSACSTGRGRLLSGEGVVGLARAFFYAGSRSVVVSLWNVNDGATAELMQRFYAGLQNGESKAAALRHAKLALLRSSPEAWRNPHFWAAFTLQGAAD